MVTPVRVRKDPRSEECHREAASCTGFRQAGCSSMPRGSKMLSMAAASGEPSEGTLTAPGCQRPCSSKPQSVRVLI